MKSITWAGVLVLCFATVTAGEDKPKGVKLSLDGYCSPDTKAAAEALQGEMLGRIAAWNEQTKAVVGQSVTVSAIGKSFTVKIRVETQGMSIERASTFLRELMILAAAKGRVVLTLFVQSEED